jgi:O-antigen/teichoic acid export membrane protein
MSGQPRLVPNAAAAMLNVVAGAVMLFVLYRFLLRELGAEALGAWSLIVASISAARLSDLGVAASVTRFVAGSLARDDRREAAHTAEAAVLLLALLGTLAAVAAALFAPWLVRQVIPANQLGAALAALPWALAGLATGLAGGALLSALDGCQRVDLRVWASLGGQASLLVATIMWAPEHGLAGVAAAQLVHSCVTLVIAWFVLRRQLPTLSILPRRWHVTALRRMWTYSVLFQFNNVLVIVLDPAVKFLVNRFGGLEATAYFDMATQLIQRVRQVIVAAAQVMVPAVAAAHEAGIAGVRALYEKSYRVVFAATVPFFCALAILIPSISGMWIGRMQRDFIVMAWICSTGLALNTIGSPAYFSNLGTGAIARNSAGHAINLALAVIAGWVLGALAGAWGVSAGYVAGLAAGGLYIQIGLMRRLSLPFSTLLPMESRPLLIACAAAVLLCGIADHLLLGSDVLPADHAGAQLLRATCLALLFIGVTGRTLWRHPLALRARLRGAREVT